MTVMLISFLTSRLKLPQGLVEALLGAFVVLALAGGSYYLGWSHRGAADDAAHAEALAATEAKWRQQVSELQAKGEDIAARAIAQDSMAQQSYQQLREEVPHVVTIVRTAPAASCPALAAAPVRSEFTTGFVGVWNGALDAGAGRMPATAGGAPGAAAAADAAAASDVDQSDVLSNHIDNAERAAQCRHQLDALIDAIHAEGLSR